MSSSGVETTAPLAATTRTRPPFSVTNLRPSGAKATAVGEFREPLVRSTSAKPLGSVVAPAGAAAMSASPAVRMSVVSRFPANTAAKVVAIRPCRHRSMK